MPHGVHMVLDADEQAVGLELRNQRLSGGKAVLTRVRTSLAGHPTVFIDDGHLRQAVPLPHREIVRVVGGRHLHGASPELGVDEGILNERQLPAPRSEAERCGPRTDW